MNIFYSYSHKDEKFRETMEKFLISLRKDGLISEWHDRKIDPGENWNEEIQRNLDNADIIVLLISQDYIASKACSDEMKYALEHINTKTIVPIILRKSTWKDTECKRLQALPKDGRPISNWDNPDEAWMNVYEGIKRIIEKKNEIKYKNSFIQEIEKINFVSTTKKNVTLTDLFVWPEFQLYSINTSEKNIEGSITLFSSIKAPLSILTGVELSGKTSIARQLILDSIKFNIKGLLLDGDMIFKTKKFDAMAENAFSLQYQGDFTEYKKVKNKLLIIDNFHHKVSKNIISWGKSNFDYMLVIIENEEFMLYYKDDESFADFNIYSINSMSSYKTYELIKKWKELDKNRAIDKQNFELEIDNLEDKVRNIVNHNHIVPNYPFYILSVIQAFEGFMPSDYQITTYGHCYNALITSQLLKKGISATDLDDCYNFLTFIAYNFFINLDKSDNIITQDHYENIKKTYKENYIIKNSLITRIENNDYPIIRINHDVRFEYPYIYYFFVGKYLAEHPDNSVIANLCESIYRKDSAYALIFTIHHTTSSSILDEIQLHCMCSFDKQSASTLVKEETIFMDSLILEIPDKIINKNSIEDNRKDIRKREDNRTIEDKISNNENIDESNNELIEIQRAFKIIDVLGQIIKNRAGTFDRKKVKELLLEVEDLGFRILRYFLDTLKDPLFSKWLEARLIAIEKELKIENKKINDNTRKKYIEKNIQLMGMIIIISMIQKIFLSVRTEKILEVQHKITDEKSSPAYDFIDLLFTLNYDGLKLNYVKPLFYNYDKDKNIWASKTLSAFLQHYMNTHTVDKQVRQQICTLLNIKYIPNRFQKK